MTVTPKLAGAREMARVEITEEPTGFRAAPAVPSYPLYIDGADVESGRWTYVVDSAVLIRDDRSAFRLKRALELGRPVDPAEMGAVVARCAVSDQEHNERAIAAARRAADGFAALPQAVRSQIILDFNQALRERCGELIDILIHEGHPRRLAQWEVSGMIQGTDERTVRYLESQLHQRFETDGKVLELVRKPDGVVCLNPPQNAAGSNSTLGILSLISGNTLVVKAPRSTPLAVFFVYRELLVPALQRNGAPAGTVNLISGHAGKILRAWIDHPDVDDILFVGDSKAGLDLGVECLRQGKKAVLELAGNDGLVVWKDADLGAAARALEESFYGSSQICMVPKYALVHPDVADEFLAVFTDRVAALRPGLPSDPNTLLSPVLKVDRFVDHLSQARNAGCAVLTGGRRVNVTGAVSTTGAFIEPTVIRVDGLNLAATLSCVTEETFFPLLPVVVLDRTQDADMLEQAIAFVNDNRYGLRNSVWTTDDGVAEVFARRITNGGLLKINDSHIGFTSPLATHGGTGDSGGPFGELNYAGLRTSHLQGVSWGDGDPRPLDAAVTARDGSAAGAFDPVGHVAGVEAVGQLG